jgi:hypothetical protein
VAFSSNASANGDQAFGDFVTEAGAGVGIAMAGKGLSGRREGGPNVPVTTATLSLGGVPVGSQILHAYLYWVVYGHDGDASVDFAGTNLTGTLIGTSGPTCWPDSATEELATAANRVYRADVKSLVTGNGDFTLSEFPSGEFLNDTQGAQLLVIYDDPASTVIQRVMVRDGAITGNGNTPDVTDSFSLIPEGPHIDARWYLAGGDGQQALTDGALHWEGLPINQIGGGHIFKNGEGQFWDIVEFDVTTRLDLTEPNVTWYAYNTGVDCIAFAVSALTYTLNGPPLDAGIPVDGGSGGADGSAGGASGASGTSGTAGVPGASGTAGGSSDASTGGAANSGSTGDAEDTGGCGCELRGTRSTSFIALSCLVAGALYRRLRRDSRTSA